MSIIRRSARFAADLGAVARAFTVSPGFRSAAMTALAAPSTPLELSAAARAELDRVPAAARPYAGQSGGALALAILRPGAPAPSVRLVLADLDPRRLFAGVATALGAAAGIARRTALPLEVVVLSEAIDPADRAALAEAVAARTGLAHSSITVTLRSDLVQGRVHPDDIWIVTHWTTAHPALVAARAGVIDASRVVYLVQDYEPGFFALSTESVTASSTYHAGFLPLVNSLPVASVLAEQESVVIDPALVFGPDLDLDRLDRIRRGRTTVEERTVLFYGRPSKPRNLFSLGIGSLRIAAQQLEGAPVRFVSAGEQHRPIDLGSGHRLDSVGTLDWEGYFALLAASNVVLSLQASPHPSHPPLEAALSGAIAVTNEVAGTRAGLHPGLRAVEADPLALGTAVAEAVTEAGASAVGQLALGGPLDDALDELTSRLGARGED